MLTLAIIGVGLAVAAGATLATLHVLGRRVPRSAGLAHGVLASAAVIVLAAAVFAATRPPAVNAALLCLALSWIGGLFNLLFRRQMGSAPGFMIALHAGVALLGVILLAVGVGAVAG